MLGAPRRRAPRRSLIVPIGFHFAPDAERARLIDRRMHRELGASLAHIAARASGIVDFDADGLARLVDNLAAGGPVAPSVFARYFDLVTAITEEDAVETVRLLDALVRAEPASRAMAIHTLGDDALGDDTARYMRMMNSDPSLDLGFGIPERDVAAAFAARLDDGFRLLDTALPELAGEIRAIIRTIIIAGSEPTKTYQFDGGSHYQLWGALFLNANFHPDRVAVAEVLAHESAHSLLFGFCTDEALVLNDDEVLYASPLRVDPRPMDGIYHATFVSARMHWAMTALSASPVLDSAERERAREAAASDMRNFHAGYAVVAEHGALTALGAAVMANAKAYIDQAEAGDRDPEGAKRAFSRAG